MTHPIRCECGCLRTAHYAPDGECRNCQDCEGWMPTNTEDEDARP